MADLQPGQVITPRAADDPVPDGNDTTPDGAPQPDRPAPLPPNEPNPEPDEAPPPTPEPEPASLAPIAPMNAAAMSEEPQGWQYNNAETQAPQPTGQLPNDITWTASEFIAHEKGASWYGLLALAGLGAAALDYWLTKDKFSAGVIVLVAIAFGVLAARKPRTQQYALTHQGLQIGNKAYFFHDYKNFSVSEEGAIASIIFVPLKRFMPPLTVYVSPEMENQVFDFLSQLLPFEPHRTDAVDGLLKRIRF